MKILFIAPGFPPYMFSENIVNGKLVLAFKEEGWDVDVLSKRDDGKVYSDSWTSPFRSLQEITHEIMYPKGSRILRLFDFIHSSIILRGFPINGVRWGKRAYQKAMELLKENNYDLIITRSPNDIAHLVGYKISKKTKIPWIANWNDPSTTIWPEPYKHKLSFFKNKILTRFTSEALKKANFNTFPSKTLKNHFSRHFPFLENERTDVIPHISLIGYKAKSVSFKEESNNSLRLCHAGNLSSERNPDLLLQTIKKIKDENSMIVNLDIMGVVNKYTENLINKYNLQNQIKFIGAFKYIDALNKMSKYDVLVIIEAEMESGIFFPSKLVDYTQANVPILAISPNTGYAKDLFLKYPAGITVNNKDKNDIFEKISKLANLKLKNKLTTEFDFESLQSVYSSEEIIRKYKAIFKKLKL